MLGFPALECAGCNPLIIFQKTTKDLWQCHTFRHFWGRKMRLNFFLSPGIFRLIAPKLLTVYLEKLHPFFSQFWKNQTTTLFETKSWCRIGWFFKWEGKVITSMTPIFPFWKNFYSFWKYSGPNFKKKESK